MPSLPLVDRVMSPLRLVVFTALSMLAFTGNALICRAALLGGTIDAASFTMLRLLSGAVMLWLIILLRKVPHRAVSPSVTDRIISGFVLFAYAAAFSYAYARVSAGAGALILFAAVQTVMIGYGFFRGERFNGLQWLGLLLAYAGLLALMLPSAKGATADSPSLFAYLIMLVSGAAWGVYSLLGRKAGDPRVVSAHNFLYALPFAALLSVLMLAVEPLQLGTEGVCYALLSGAGASALGYIVWYSALPELKATTAASVQLSVPLMTAFGGILLLSEPFTLHFFLVSCAIIGGLAMVIFSKSQRVEKRRLGSS